MLPPCRIELFGGLRLLQGGRTVTHFRTQKTGSLLGYLAHYGDQAHPREVLIELFWPHCEPTAGRASLSVALSSLRRQLEPPGVPPGAILRADRGSVGLNPEAVATDTAEFEAAARAGLRHQAAADRARILSAAVALCRGEFLLGYYEDWILAEQRRLADLCAQILHDLVLCCEQARDYSGGLRHAWQGVRLDPLREEAHQDLMRLYARAGHPELALRQFHELERALAEELEVPPSEETRRLAGRVEQGWPGAPAALPAAVEPPAPARADRARKPPVGTVTLLLMARPGDREVVPAPGAHLPRPTTPTAGGAPLSAMAGEPPAAQRSAGAADPVGPAATRADWESRKYGGYPMPHGAATFAAYFPNAGDAVACAAHLHRTRVGAEAAAAAGNTVAAGAGGVRIALDTGWAEVRGDHYEGAVLRRTEHLLRAAAPGQVLCSERTAALAQPDLEPGVGLADLGIYLAGDKGAPERLFQVTYAGMPIDLVAAPQCPPALSGSLPAPPLRFLGRKKEVRDIRRLVASGEVRLVTLTGPAGIGKTRLAIEAARGLQDTYRGAIWLVPLAALADARAIPDQILDCLHLERYPRLDPMLRVMQALLGRPGVLLLDNLEHLLPQAAPVIQQILEQVPDVTCLATSRRRIGIAGEREVPIAPLPVPGAEDPPDLLSRCDSVRLFEDRVRAVQPEFHVTASNARAVSAICARLEGIPLALELAAARAGVLTPEETLARLSSPLDVGADAGEDGPSAVGSLKAALDWSYRLLAPALQAFFPRLSVFRGGFTLEAVERVTDEPLALDYLAQLRGWSLLTTDAAGGQTRFRLLETLREYGERLLPPPERASLAWRHAAYFGGLASVAAPCLLGPEQGRWIGRLASEHDNLRAALAWSLSADEGMETALGLAGALWPFWYTQGHLAEGLGWLEQALSRGSDGAPALRAPVLLGAAALAVATGDLERSRTWGEDGLALCREIGDSAGQALALNVLGLTALSQGEVGSAERLHREALAVAQDGPDAWNMALALSGLADLAIAVGRFDDAAELARGAATHARAVGEKWLTAYSVGTRGLAAALLGAGGEAIPLLQESMLLFREIGDALGMANCVEALARVALLGGDAPAAVRLLGACAAFRHTYGTPLTPLEEQELDGHLALARDLLGDAAFEAAWEAGSRLSFEEAAAAALGNAGAG